MTYTVNGSPFNKRQGVESSTSMCARPVGPALSQPLQSDGSWTEPGSPTCPQSPLSPAKPAYPLWSPCPIVSSTRSPGHAGACAWGFPPWESKTRESPCEWPFSCVHILIYMHIFICTCTYSYGVISN